MCSSFAGFSSSEIAATAFPLGSVSVLPFYVFMVVAPKAEFVSFLDNFRGLLAYLAAGLPKIVTVASQIYCIYKICVLYSNI